MRCDQKQTIIATQKIADNYLYQLNKPYKTPYNIFGTTIALINTEAFTAMR
jgi:hypothetical protein